MNNYFITNNCCIVQHNRHQYIAKLIDKVTSTQQGQAGPARWKCQLICVLDGAPVTDGEVLELSEAQIVSKATREDIAFACFRQGWREVDDVIAYLACYGVTIKGGTIGGYRSIWLRSGNAVKGATHITRPATRSSIAFTKADVAKWNRLVKDFGGARRVKEIQQFIQEMRKA